MSKQYSSGAALNESILNGVNRLADSVVSTLGPRGRNVILHQKGKSPIVTKDGVTVASFVDLEDPMENIGAQIVKQAAFQTNAKAGDGTTTSTAISRAILTKAQKYLAAGSAPIELKKGIDKAVEAMVLEIGTLAKPVTSQEDIRHIATISANNDEVIGNLIAMAADQAGKDGAITVEEARSLETSLDVIEGFRFDSGYFATAFITDERKGTVKYDDCFLLVTDYKISLVEEIMPTLEIISRDGRPLIIIAEEVDGQALAALIMNKTRGTLRVAAIKAPGYGEERRNILKDLCVSTGATFVSRESGIGLGDIELKDLGSCRSIEALKNLTTIVGGAADMEAIEKTIDSLKVQITQTSNLKECERIQERITRLASGIAIIKVGAATEVEMVEKKHRIEDALEAVKSAQEEGMVPGGGTALLRVANIVENDISRLNLTNHDQELGAKIIFDAAKEPIRQMALNASYSPDLVTAMVEEAQDHYGYNFVTGEITDLLEAGVIDPAKVTRVALQNAASVATALITSGHAIIEI
tara:strand:+ start:4133 stop:5716 length:1584 start_codon:yes stop_codon:yes gene_type:complete